MIKDTENIIIQVNINVSSTVRSPHKFTCTITKHRTTKAVKTTVYLGHHTQPGPV